MSQLQDQLENIPGYGLVVDQWNDYAEEHYNKLDPYKDEEGHTLKLRSPYSTPEEKKLWNQVRKKAWVHDKCFLGSCAVGLDCGLGLAPLVVTLFPGLGPLLMYVVHARLIHMVTNQYHLPNKLIMKLESQIMFDMLISFPPVIGGLFAWLHGCLTRNAAYIYRYFDQMAKDREKNQSPIYEGPSVGGRPQPAYTRTSRAQNYTTTAPSTQHSNRKMPNKSYVSDHQVSGFR